MGKPWPLKDRKPWRPDDWDEIKSKLPHDEHYQDYDFEAGADAMLAVSYTHLTLPTILLV